MNTNFTAMAALASGLLMMTGLGAAAAPSVDLNNSAGTGPLIRVAHGGGGGGGAGGLNISGAGGGGGGGHISGGGNAGASAHITGNGGTGPSGHMARNIDRGNNVAGRNFDRGDHFKRGDNRFASRDHDHNGNFNRHRVFRNGVWVWVYGPDTYAYGSDCGWLYRRAVATGSPYWWSRYHECLY